MAVLAVAACKGHDAPPASTEGPPAPTGARVTLVGCALAEPPPAGVHPAMAWTPFGGAPREVEPPLAARAVAAIGGELGHRLPALDTCFARRSGRVRVMVELGAHGDVDHVRAGGLGDAAVDACIAREVAGVHGDVTAPMELACDLERGGPQPWRVTTSAYHVIDVTATEIRNARSAQPTALVLAAPDAPGALVDRALAALTSGPVVVAVKAQGGAPVYVGPGGEATEAKLGIVVEAGVARACAGTEALPASARVIDPAALDRLMQAARGRCTAPCTAVIGTRGAGYTAKDLVAVSAAARRAAIPIVVGGVGCP